MSKKKVPSLDELVSGLREMPEKYIRSGCLPFDMLTGGKGLRVGYLYQLFSSSGYGKSTLCLSLCRSLAANGHKSIYVASEKNDELVDSMGLSGDRYRGLFSLYPIMTYKDLEQVTWSFFESDYTLMVIDSITACFPSKMVEDDISIEDSLPGINARIRGDYLRIIQGMVQRKEKVIVYLNQTRANFDSGWGGDSEVAEGGHANKFYCMIQATIKGDARVPDLVSSSEKRTIGKQGTLVSLKNRCVDPWASIPLRIYFGKGVSNVYMLEHFCLWRGLITGAGAWFNCSLDGGVTVDKVNGKRDRQEWVRKNQDALSDLLYSSSEDYYRFLLGSESSKLVV
jgi:RecA/RadA recombinase